MIYDVNSPLFRSFLSQKGGASSDKRKMRSRNDARFVRLPHGGLVERDQIPNDQQGPQGATDSQNTGSTTQEAVPDAPPLQATSPAPLTMLAMYQMGQMLLLMQQQQQMILMQQQQQMMTIMMGVMAHNMGVQRPEQPGMVAPATNTGNLFEQFQRFRPPTFAGTHRPEEAEYWLNRVTKLLRPLHCSEVESVELLSYLFEKEADLWWESVLRTVPENHVWTWEAFEGRFNQKYLPQTYHHERENEFLRLQQGGMSVAQYENRFTELSRYASQIVTDEAIKMMRFTEGLRSGIRSKMCCASIRTYAELVEMSIRAEQDEERVSRTCSQLGPRSRIEGSSSSFVGKRPRPNSPPRLAATPAPSTRPTQICNYCRRIGHSEPYCFARMRDLGFTPPQRINRPPKQAL